MSKLQVFDPPMCCSTGVCGPQVDPALVRFAADLDWLKTNGVEVERFNLSQQAAAFVGNPVVAAAIRGRDDALPLLLLDGKIIAQGSYPEREELAGRAGLAAPKSIYGEAVQELVAIGAAIASNCEPCFRFHYDKARKLGVSKEDMARAVATAQMVKDAPARAVLALAQRYLGTEPDAQPVPAACCPPVDAAAVTRLSPAGAPKKCC
ncbi:arsenite efflux transporter metallochaperone ArsD [Anaeromyxobacter sp. PSR-1]|uniref:arsenite efflux transporter metallochaperone ArsD n=1 Tax=Anaeromyxobacter sp. PSR-1 TaxID=1300915 RepID=UPI0005EA2FB8|nr:arsenite efflux transporter metallochaperone ArsD [Anaeromyxobacter sp. PSR-1]GAO01270.1 arsenical resistance operon trans-acting repressor ArsD [Anaeromyxobacter sp. PSR-1]